MARDSTAVVVAGSGGAGAITAGSILLRAAACAGDHAQIDELLEREPVPHPDWARDCDPPAEPE